MRETLTHTWLVYLQYRVRPLRYSNRLLSKIINCIFDIPIRKEDYRDPCSSTIEVS